MISLMTYNKFPLGPHLKKFQISIQPFHHQIYPFLDNIPVCLRELLLSTQKTKLALRWQSEWERFTNVWMDMRWKSHSLSSHKLCFFSVSSFFSYRIYSRVNSDVLLYNKTHCQVFYLLLDHSTLPFCFMPDLSVPFFEVHFTLLMAVVFIHSLIQSFPTFLLVYVNSFVFFIADVLFIWVDVVH